MKCEFSEMQYTVCALREITAKLNPAKGWFAPIVPTQADEKDLGYDCELTDRVHTLFFQFKVPRKLTRALSKYWSDFYDEYYEFKIWPNSLTPQHNKLVELANKNSKNAVFYCSPAFITQDEFSIFYRRNEICNNSIMIDCQSLIKINGNDKHVITYRLNPREYYMHSDNFKYAGMDFTKFINRVMETESYVSLEQCVDVLGEELNITYNSNKNIQENLRAIAYQLLINYNIFLVLF